MSNSTASEQTIKPITPALYVVATPIGNMQDITLRAIEILKQVDFIAAEDTRHSAPLLAHFGITKQCLAVHEHNEQKAAQTLLQKIQQGQSVALITDAGTPAISDPGAVVVDVLLNAGVRVVPIPGASAVTAAMSVAGMAGSGYQFYGFLPASSKQRKAVLQQYAHLPHSIVFYEAPHRILACIQDSLDVLGAEREMLIARELTKQFETIYRAPLAEILRIMQEDSNQLRGEFVLVLSPQLKQPEESDASAWQKPLKVLMAELPLKQAVKLCAEITGAKKNLVYDFALKMKQDD